MRKMGHFKVFEYIKKWGISRKNHVINIKTGKELKLNIFLEIMHTLSRAKYILHMLVGAF